MNSMTYVTSFAETLYIKMISDENMAILIWIYRPTLHPRWLPLLKMRWACCLIRVITF